SGGSGNERAHARRLNCGPRLRDRHPRHDHLARVRILRRLRLLQLDLVPETSGLERHLRHRRLVQSTQECRRSFAQRVAVALVSINAVIAFALAESELRGEFYEHGGAHDRMHDRVAVRISRGNLIAVAVVDDVAMRIALRQIQAPSVLEPRCDRLGYRRDEYGEPAIIRPAVAAGLVEPELMPRLFHCDKLEHQSFTGAVLSMPLRPSIPSLPFLAKIRQSVACVDGFSLVSRSAMYAVPPSVTTSLFSYAPFFQ